MAEMCTLEEFFADDADVPQHYICNTFTHSILIEPVILNGRLYESKKIKEWLNTNKTDPFSRERVSSSKLVQPVLKSAIGLDVFMMKKVDKYFQALQQRCMSQLDKKQMEQLFDDFVTFLCCIALPTTENVVALPKNKKILHEEEHYVIARKQAAMILVQFDRNNLVERLLIKCQDNKIILDNVLAMITKVYEEADKNNTVDVKYSISNIPIATGTPNLDKPTPITPIAEYSEDESSDFSLPYRIPKGMPVSLAALVPLSTLMLPSLSPNSPSAKLILLQSVAEKRDAKSFFKKFKVKHVILTRNKLLIYNVANKGIPSSSNQDLIALNRDNLDDRLPSEKELVEEMSLEGISISRYKDKKKENNCAFIVSETENNEGKPGKRKWIIQLESETECSNWIYTIKFCIFLS
jgi:hypothetical protein